MGIDQRVAEVFYHIVRVCEANEVVPRLKDERDDTTTFFFALEDDGDACDFFVSRSPASVSIQYSGHVDDVRGLMRLTYAIERNTWSLHAYSDTETVDEECDAWDQEAVDSIIAMMCYLATRAPTPVDEPASPLFT